MRDRRRQRLHRNITQACEALEARALLSGVDVGFGSGGVASLTPADLFVSDIAVDSAGNSFVVTGTNETLSSVFAGFPTTQSLVGLDVDGTVTFSTTLPATVTGVPEVELLVSGNVAVIAPTASGIDILQFDTSGAFLSTYSITDVTPESGFDGPGPSFDLFQDESVAVGQNEATGAIYIGASNFDTIRSQAEEVEPGTSRTHIIEFNPLDNSGAGNHFVTGTIEDFHAFDLELSDGQVVVGGVYQPGDGGVLGVARMNATNTAVDASFGIGGISSSSAAFSNSENNLPVAPLYLDGLSIASDGSIAMAMFNRVFHVDASGDIVPGFDTPLIPTSDIFAFRGIGDVLFDANDNLFYVESTSSTGILRKLDSSGSPDADFGDVDLGFQAYNLKLGADDLVYALGGVATLSVGRFVPPTPAPTTETIIEVVEEIASEGDISQRFEDRLTRTLDRVQRRLDRGADNRAVRTLRRFQRQVFFGALLGRVSVGDAQRLLELSSELIDQIQSDV